MKDIKINSFEFPSVRFWCVLFFLSILALLMLSSTVTPIRMEIPTQDQVQKVKGIFKDTSKGVYSKTGLYSIAIVDSDGVDHSCNCLPLSNSNCLDNRLSDNSKVANLLDIKLVKTKGVHRAMLNWLDDKEGEIWLYQNRGLIGSNYSCYQISDKSNVYLSFNKSKDAYLKAKKSAWHFIIFCILATAFLFFTYIKIRVSRNRQRA